jgi:hypothetical protein
MTSDVVVAGAVELAWLVQYSVCTYGFKHSGYQPRGPPPSEDVYR